MDSANIPSTWQEVKRRIQQSYTQLTDEDLSYEHGQDLEVIRRIQNRLQCSRGQVQDILASAF